MKTALTKVIALLSRLKETTNDDELEEEIDAAIMHLEAAQDRLTAIDEELDALATKAAADPLDDGDYAYDAWKDSQLTD